MRKMEIARLGIRKETAYEGRWKRDIRDKGEGEHKGERNRNHTCGKWSLKIVIQGEIP